MNQDKILEEIHQIREAHAKSFNYDIKAICADWRKRQVESGKKFVTLTPQNRLKKASSYPQSEEL
ncbi:MAG: hypothetical protein RLZZ69_197 [Cyanobacteriota bacterium]|jgi:hypothetical protein